MKTKSTLNNSILSCFLIISVVCGISNPFNTQAQSNPTFIFHNQGALVEITPGTLVWCNGGIENNDGGFLVPGTFTNNGTLVTRSITDKATNIFWPGDMLITGGIFHGNGTYRVQRHWTNNQGKFNGDASTVLLDDNAGTDQNIDGSTSTTFNNLSLDMTSASKAILFINTQTGPNGLLALSDRELATGAFDMTVENPDVNSINQIHGGVATTGFVSSSPSAGALIRKTNSTNTYLFPLGSSTNGKIYRPVEITPTNNNEENSYGASLIDEDPNTQNLPTPAASATPFNLNFYHSIYRPTGTASADIAISYDIPTDGDWTGIFFHDSNKKDWKTTGTSFTGNNQVFTTKKRLGWTFSRNPDKYFILHNEVEDSIANVFTPNPDPDNQVWHLKNQNVKEYSVKIFNRWGVLLYQSTAEQIDWDGKTFSGADVVDGTYYYELVATQLNDDKITKTGFITVIR